MKSKQATLFKWYIDHQTELLSKYNNKVLVITDGGVSGCYESESEAYFETRKLEKGSYIIQKCSEGTEDYTAHYYSRVSFS